MYVYVVVDVGILLQGESQGYYTYITCIYVCTYMYMQTHNSECQISMCIMQGLKWG